MIAICITIVLVVAIVCATICYVYREKAYASSDLSEQQLLEDVNIRVNNAFSRYLDEYNRVLSGEMKPYPGFQDMMNTLEDIMQMTYNYKHNED